MRLLPLLLLASCGSTTARLWPDRLDVTPFASEGTLARVGSPNRADSERWGLAVTLGWDLNSDRTEAYRNLSRLQVDRQGSLSLAEGTESDPVVVVTPGGDTEPQGPSEGKFPWGEVMAAAGALALTVLTWLRMRVTGTPEGGADGSGDVPG